MKHPSKFAVHCTIHKLTIMGGFLVGNKVGKITVFVYTNFMSVKLLSFDIITTFALESRQITQEHYIECMATVLSVRPINVNLQSQDNNTRYWI